MVEVLAIGLVERPTFYDKLYMCTQAMAAPQGEPFGMLCLSGQGGIGGPAGGGGGALMLILPYNYPKLAEIVGELRRPKQAGGCARNTEPETRNPKHETRNSPRFFFTLKPRVESLLSSLELSTQSL